MDFSNRNVQPQAAAPGAQTTAAGNSGHKKSKKNDSTTARVVKVLLGLILLLLVAAAFIALLTGNQKPENKYVDSSKLQAVFLNTGQVYFGTIKTLNNRYFVLSNIYYLQTAGGGTTANASSANSSVTLVKLGCELHEPFDQMVINRDQVTFWENLQDNGQVAKAVTTFQKQNPNGQKCADQSASSGSTTNSTQPANNGSTTPSTTTPAKP